MVIGYSGAFLGGLLTLLSPCSALLLPAFFAYAFSTKRQLVGRTMLFYAGLLCTLVPLGVFAGTLGSLATTDRHLLIGFAAALMISLGLLQILGVRLPAFVRPRSATRGSGSSIFVLGLAYGVAGACTGPILGSILTVAAAGSNAVYGGILLAIYALGMAVPLFFLAALWDRLGVSGRRWLRPRPITIGRWSNSWVMVVSGTLSIGIGLFLLATDGTASLGGILSVTDQFAVENAARSFAKSIPDVAVLLIILILLAITGAIYLHRRRHSSSGASFTASPDQVSKETS
ncbi:MULTISPECIES: cytochrome c biogenesis CcdA family protein [unclassified Arthrobacter]|uniref:cytochrome c biogenesis CcdA family protein n=1 Tax=unclassified Arthrobacter TaxID=235627 RepID=UPI0004657BFE|nr:MULTISPECIES: cytochrome c biogenesis CcdA family protein [unclassified Arthrobacter]MBE0010998.1 cytochrome c biogenesis protein CcdA [Arthrobacter sp. AET 35A]PVE15154.1 cytochrome c biogenesis protein CcdA [Arthrobacter sp. Bz4]